MNIRARKIEQFAGAKLDSRGKQLGLFLIGAIAYPALIIWDILTLLFCGRVRDHH